MLHVIVLDACPPRIDSTSSTGLVEQIDEASLRVLMVHTKLLVMAETALLAYLASVMALPTRHPYQLAVTSTVADAATPFRLGDFAPRANSMQIREICNAALRDGAGSPDPSDAMNRTLSHVAMEIQQQVVAQCGIRRVSIITANGVVSEEGVQALGRLGVRIDVIMPSGNQQLQHALERTSRVLAPLDSPRLASVMPGDDAAMATLMRAWTQDMLPVQSAQLHLAPEDTSSTISCSVEALVTPRSALQTLLSLAECQCHAELTWARSHAMRCKLACTKTKETLLVAQQHWLCHATEDAVTKTAAASFRVLGRLPLGVVDLTMLVGPSFLLSHPVDESLDIDDILRDTDRLASTAAAMARDDIGLVLQRDLRIEVHGTTRELKTWFLALAMQDPDPDDTHPACLVLTRIASAEEMLTPRLPERVPVSQEAVVAASATLSRVPELGTWSSFTHAAGLHEAAMLPVRHAAPSAANASASGAGRTSRRRTAQALPRRRRARHRSQAPAQSTAAAAPAPGRSVALVLEPTTSSAATIPTIDTDDAFAFG